MKVEDLFSEEDLKDAKKYLNSEKETAWEIRERFYSEKRKVKKTDKNMDYFDQLTE